MLVLRLAGVGGWMGLLQATRSVRRAQPFEATSLIAARHRETGRSMNDRDGRSISLSNSWTMARLAASMPREKITEFPLPEPTGGSPDDIVGGSDGPLWFTMPNGFPDAIGRV